MQEQIYTLLIGSKKTNRQKIYSYLKIRIGLVAAAIIAGNKAPTIAAITANKTIITT